MKIYFKIKIISGSVSQTQRDLFSAFVLSVFVEFTNIYMPFM